MADHVIDLAAEYSCPKDSWQFVRCLCGWVGRGPDQAAVDAAWARHLVAVATARPASLPALGQIELELAA